MRMHKCMYMYIVYMTLNDSGDRKRAFQSFTRLADCMLTHTRMYIRMYVRTYMHVYVRVRTLAQKHQLLTLETQKQQQHTTHMG